VRVDEQAAGVENAESEGNFNTVIAAKLNVAQAFNAPGCRRAVLDGDIGLLLVEAI